jgi:hypothetical protein
MAFRGGLGRPEINRLASLTAQCWTGSWHDMLLYPTAASIVWADQATVNRAWRTAARIRILA